MTGDEEEEEEEEAEADVRALPAQPTAAAAAAAACLCFSTLCLSSTAGLFAGSSGVAPLSTAPPQRAAAAAADDDGDATGVRLSLLAPRGVVTLSSEAWLSSEGRPLVGTAGQPPAAAAAAAAATACWPPRCSGDGGGRSGGEARPRLPPLRLVAPGCDRRSSSSSAGEPPPPPPAATSRYGSKGLTGLPPKGRVGLVSVAGGVRCGVPGSRLNPPPARPAPSVCASSPLPSSAPAPTCARREAACPCCLARISGLLAGTAGLPLLVLLPRPPLLPSEGTSERGGGVAGSTPGCRGLCLGGML
jgi:hypothetical protein